VTVLSEAEAEWEEMLAKRESLLKVFGGGDGA
jgi:anthranilate/para-aminobenzoate synthase component I